MIAGLDIETRALHAVTSVNDQRTYAIEPFCPTHTLGSGAKPPKAAGSYSSP
jgi:hypothetical protein